MPHLCRFYVISHLCRIYGAFMSVLYQIYAIFMPHYYVAFVSCLFLIDAIFMPHLCRVYVVFMSHLCHMTYFESNLIDFKVYNPAPNMHSKLSFETLHKIKLGRLIRLEVGISEHFAPQCELK